MQKMQFTVGGQAFETSREEIERGLEGIAPEPVTKVFVYVDGKKYPVKQALAVPVGLIRSGFTTQEALRVLKKLGFTVGEGNLAKPQDRFQIEGKVFNVDGRVWRAQIVNTPGGNTDLVYFKLAFKEGNQSAATRVFTAVTSDISLHHDQDGRYKDTFFYAIRHWLSTGESTSELQYLG